MHRRLRGNIFECYDLVVFIELACRDIPSHDLAEQAIHGIPPGVERLDSVTGRFEADESHHKEMG